MRREASSGFIAWKRERKRFGAYDETGKKEQRWSEPRSYSCNSQDDSKAKALRLGDGSTEVEQSMGNTYWTYVDSGDDLRKLETTAV